MSNSAVPGEFAYEVSEAIPKPQDTVSAASGDATLLLNLPQSRAEDLPSASPNDRRWSELGHLVERAERVESHDAASIVWSPGKGTFFVQGSTTRLGLTLFAMLATMGIVVGKGNPVHDAYGPMVLVGVVSLSHAYMDNYRIRTDDFKKE